MTWKPVVKNIIRKLNPASVEASLLSRN